MRFSSDSTAHLTTALVLNMSELPVLCGARFYLDSALRMTTPFFSGKKKYRRFDECAASVFRTANLFLSTAVTMQTGDALNIIVLSVTVHLELPG
jgi:hypothetical protein